MTRVLSQRVRDDAACELMQLVLEGAAQDPIMELAEQLKERLRGFSGPPGVAVWLDWVLGLARTGRKLRHPQVIKDSLITLLSSKYLNWPTEGEDDAGPVH